MLLQTLLKSRNWGINVFCHLLGEIYVSEKRIQEMTRYLQIFFILVRIIFHLKKTNKSLRMSWLEFYDIEKNIKVHSFIILTITKSLQCI